MFYLIFRQLLKQFEWASQKKINLIMETHTICEKILLSIKQLFNIFEDKFFQNDDVIVQRC